MSDSLFDLVQEAADRLGSCEPKWLVKRKEPNFKADRHGESGPDVMLLHGLLGAMSNWEDMLPHMAKYAQPIVFGFPLLDGHRSEVKIKALAAYTEYYIRKEKIEPAVLCGNSLGGHVALRLALTSPELVDCLILSGTSGLYEHTVDSLPLRVGEHFVREHMVKVFYNEDLATEEKIQEIVDILSSRMNTLNLIHAARSAKRDNLQDRLKEITAPTLLLWGENDTVTPMDVAHKFEELLPNAKLVSIDKCGHAPMIEHPEWFASEVDKFLKEHSRHYKG